MITLYNPHSQDFIFKPLAFILAKRKPLCKYGYIKDILLENKGFFRYLCWLYGIINNSDESLRKITFIFKKNFYKYWIVLLVKS